MCATSELEAASPPVSLLQTRLRALRDLEHRDHPIEVEFLSIDTAIISIRGEHGLETSHLIEAALAATTCRPS